MLSQPFVGRDALLAQLSGASVKTIDEDGSLSIKVTAGAPAGIPIRVPVTAHTEDVDGMWMELLLHVVNGRLHELEIWRGDLAPVKRWPSASNLELAPLDPILLPERSDG